MSDMRLSPSPSTNTLDHQQMLNLITTIIITSTNIITTIKGIIAVIIIVVTITITCPLAQYIAPSRGGRQSFLRDGSKTQTGRP